MKAFLIKLCLCALIFQVLPAFATVVNTPASKTARGLRDVIAGYLQKGGSIDALTMEQIMRLVDPEAANITAQGRLADRFEILGGSGPVDQVAMAKIIAYTANQIGEDRRGEPGRYVIWLADGKVYYNWESEGKIAGLFSNAGMKLANRGPWTQPDTKAQSMFHVGIGSQPPPDDNRAQEDQAGRRLPIPKAKSQNDQEQKAAQQSTPKEPGAKPPRVSEEPALTLWLVWGIIIVLAAGIVWLLRKK